MYYLAHNLFISEKYIENCLLSSESLSEIKEKKKEQIRLVDYFINNKDTLEHILEDSKRIFKPDCPNWYDFVNKKFVLNKDQKTYFYDESKEEFTFISNNHINDELYNCTDAHMVSLRIISDRLNKLKFTAYHNRLEEHEKTNIANFLEEDIFYIKVKEFEKPFIAIRKKGNGKTGYFDKTLDYFYVVRGDGTQYKYCISDVEFYINIHDYHDLTWEHI